ncbi:MULTISPECIES: ABC transporter permease [unclassified Clostridium]|uniref:ABC transporter permease n=1 Tax=Clostridium TaxID=1485 RepID=UPI000E9C1DE2|nr:peptide ABC transporter permease [Clostridium sp.]HCO74320.1 peptide ABC transporter permease [Clostridium sp.]
MIKYILKRLGISVVTIFIVITATFFLMRLMPGGPFDGEKPLPPEIKASLEAKYGLDKSLGEQYSMYLKDLLKGDLGPSMRYKGREVQEIIGYSFPASAKLGGVAVAISLIFGILLGIIAALKYNKWPDSICMVLATLGVTLPSFVIATLLMYVFGVKLSLVPITGLDNLKSYILPSVALAGYSIAFISRLTRSKLLEVLKSDYIRTAKAKGVNGRRIMFKHALRNTLIPIVTYVGPLIAGILTGSFVVEKIFAIPGLGREFVTTITNRDYTTILGVTIFYSTLLILCNLIVDIMYVIIDPRIKLENVEA